MTEEQTRQAPMARIFGLAALATLVMAFNRFGLFAGFAGFAASLGWVAMSLGVIKLFEQRPFKLWLVNSGYQVVAYAVMGGLLGVWR
jgi:hypothetical protein